MTDDADGRSPIYWGPAGPPANPELVDSWTPGVGSRNWCVYHQVLFPPRKVSPWVRFKIMTSGATIAQRLWDERQELRAEYEVAHGDDPDQWFVRHPGAVLESVQWVAHAACLGCHWLDAKGTSMTNDAWRTAAAATARRHQDLWMDDHR